MQVPTGRPTTCGLNGRHTPKGRGPGPRFETDNSRFMARFIRIFMGFQGVAGMQSQMGKWISDELVILLLCHLKTACTSLDST